MHYHDPFGLQPKASFDDHICVTASGGPCGGPITATQLARARQQFNQQQRAANGAISGPHDGGLVAAPPDMSFCSDFTCKVMADVGRNATAARAQEIAVEITLIIIPAPHFGRLGLPPLIFRALPVRPNGQLHHVISTKIHRVLERHPILKGKYRARDPRLTTCAVDDAAHRGYQRWHRDLDDEVVLWIQDHPEATQQVFESYLRTRYAASDLLRRFPQGLP